VIGLEDVWKWSKNWYICHVWIKNSAVGHQWVVRKIC